MQKYDSSQIATLAAMLLQRHELGLGRHVVRGAVEQAQMIVDEVAAIIAKPDDGATPTVG